MKYGFVIPRGDIKTILDLATLAEHAGWDGIFYWDAIYIKEVGLMYDAWTVLAAMALRTHRIRIGAMLTAVNRRRPWKLAREATTVDHLSNGRLIIPVGLGALDDGGYSKVGEPRDRKVRAELLDEGLEILIGLWSGRPFSYSGKHFKMDEMTFRPRPIQRPRIPIWVVGAWPRLKSMRRALRYDGLIPSIMELDGTFSETSPNDIREIKKFVSENRNKGAQFDIVYEGQTPVGRRKKGIEIAERWKEAGVTWWIESRWSKTAEALPRIAQGPPKPEGTG
jgi:Luciferase-like monooxygenase